MATYQYTRRPGDKAYRKVNITVSGIGKFQEFAEDVVHYPDTAVVLEVLREDGSTQLFYDGSMKSDTYVASNANTFRLSASVPTSHLWLQKKDGTGIPYKVPSDLPKEDNLVSVRVPGGVNGWELVGDRYFAKIVDLRGK